MKINMVMLDPVRVRYAGPDAEHGARWVVEAKGTRRVLPRDHALPPAEDAGRAAARFAREVLGVEPREVFVGWGGDEYVALITKWEVMK